MSTPPPGFVLHEDLLTVPEEAALLARLREVDFQDILMRGRVAKRRMACFGWDYLSQSRRLREAPPLPAWLSALRDRAAARFGLPAARFTQGILSLYPPGAGIGFHADAPVFGPEVLGISLRSPCLLRLRPVGGGAVYSVTLPPRSAYVFRGPARDAWQHEIPPVDEERYSITFRSIKT